MLNEIKIGRCGKVTGWRSLGWVEEPGLGEAVRKDFLEAVTLKPKISQG